jgi:hypothetical protein
MIGFGCKTSVIPKNGLSKCLIDLIPGYYVRGEERHRQHNSIIEGIIHLTHRIGLLPLANERSLTNLATNINSIYCLQY